MHIVKSVCAGLLVLAMQATAAVSATTWTGPMYVETVTKACSKVGIKVGSRMFVNLSPATFNGESHISFMARPKLQQIRSASGDFAQGSTYDQTFAITGKLDVLGIVSPAEVTKLVTWTQSPASFAGHPDFIALTVKLTNFIGKKGCTAQLRGNLALTSPPPP